MPKICVKANWPTKRCESSLAEVKRLLKASETRVLLPQPRYFCEPPDRTESGGAKTTVQHEF